MPALHCVLPLLLALTALPVASACRSAPEEPYPMSEAPPSDSERVRIEALLDDFHAAAAQADGERYFAHFAEGAVFLGTDATERWTVEEFRAYAAPHFAEGRGWTYVCMERHVFLGPDRGSAWFDERLASETYGACRGTGALVRTPGGWRLAHYSLTFPIPNGLAAEFTRRIRELDAPTR